MRRRPPAAAAVVLGIAQASILALQLRPKIVVAFGAPVQVRALWVAPSAQGWTARHLNRIGMKRINVASMQLYQLD